MTSSLMEISSHLLGYQHRLKRHADRNLLVQPWLSRKRRQSVGRNQLNRFLFSVVPLLFNWTILQGQVTPIRS